ncbi:MAG: hypothetical protein KatS3mg101_0190 [Patescibacteria group bacterium]|nr:MAG: hypothetical protein KatS3mg101_0190 [Patescibacteria group bacterium]
MVFLLPRGATYSLNNSIGEISAETGYDIAYIIKEGRTVLGSGGGVCQTSTTLFRAVLNSGLPIVMRYPPRLPSQLLRTRYAGGF